MKKPSPGCSLEAICGGWNSSIAQTSECLYAYDKFVWTRKYVRIDYNYKCRNKILFLLFYRHSVFAFISLFLLTLIGFVSAYVLHRCRHSREGRKKPDGHSTMVENETLRRVREYRHKQQMPQHQPQQQHDQRHRASSRMKAAALRGAVAGAVSATGRSTPAKIRKAFCSDGVFPKVPERSGQNNGAPAEDSTRAHSPRVYKKRRRRSRDSVPNSRIAIVSEAPVNVKSEPTNHARREYSSGSSDFDGTSADDFFEFNNYSCVCVKI